MTDLKQLNTSLSAFFKRLYTCFLFSLCFLIIACSSVKKNVNVEEEKCQKLLQKKQNKSNARQYSICQRQKLFNEALNYFSEPETTSPSIPSISEPSTQPDRQISSNDDNILPILNKKISFSVSSEVPVKDALTDIADTYDLDIEIDPKIDSQILLSVKNKRLYDVFKVICRNASLRYTIDGDIIRFELDKPYTKNYVITLLDSTKTGNDTFGVQSSFASSGDSSTGSSGVSISSSLSNTSEWSVWTSLEKGLNQVLAGYEGSSFNLNKQAGIITIQATEAAHESAKEYIESIKKYAMTQILVEVSLVNLTIDDSFQAGFNFQNTNKAKSQGYSSILGMPFGLPSGNFFSAKFERGGSTNMSAAINLLQQFGTARIVSSPRINVVNNQKAVLSFAENKIYFELTPSLQNQFSTGTSIANPTIPIVVSSRVKTIPIGIILSLQAVANPDTNEITLNVKPSLSSTDETKWKQDPAASFLSSVNTASGGIKNMVPVVSKKELDSVMKIKSGGIMVLGGFTEESLSEVENGVPLLMDIPFIGRLFQYRSSQKSNIETIIFVKATILNTNDSTLSSKDERLRELLK